MTTVQYAQPGALPQQSTSRLYRSSDGKTRIDAGNTSVITDPAAQQAFLLDHAKKEVRFIPMPPEPPPAPGRFARPNFGAPPVPQVTPARVEELGKGYIDGLEVEGKRYTFPPLEAPKPPELPKPPVMPQPPAVPQAQMPGVPKPPQVPQPPQPPQAPHVPPPPQPPTVAELWTSTKLQLPVYNKTTAGFGERVSHWKYRDGWQPDPAVFQVPPGYTLPPPPAPPQMPSMPQPPKIPV